MTDAYGNDAATSTGTIADTTNNAASGAPQRAESTERLARPLIKLAKACGLATSFIDQLGTYTEISDAALVAVLKALDVDASSDEAIVRSTTQLEVENSKRLLPSTIVATTEDVRERIIAMTPLGRLARPDDIAGGVALLASDMAGFITGQCLHVDGGLTMR